MRSSRLLRQDAPRVGYLLKAYPRMSETFILSEIYRLEQLGVPLRLFAIKPAEEGDREPRHPVVDRVRAAPEFLPATVSLPDASAVGWLAANLPAFAPALRRVAMARPMGLLRAAGAAAAQAWRTRSQTGSVKSRLRELLRAVALADRLGGKNGVTHLHAHYAHDTTTVAWLASQITGIPFSFTAHARDVYCEELNPRGLLRRKLAAARFAVTCSAASRDFLKRVAPRTPIHCLYHGLNADFARLIGASDRAAAAGEGLRIVAAGRLVPKKGFDRLIGGVALLRDASVPVELVLAGPEGSHGPELRRLVTDLGLTPVVRFAGALSQAALLAEYRAADVFCLPCRVLDDGDRDGIPNVLLEAMAAGLPVVSTRISGIPELIEHEFNGLLVEADDAQALAAALLRLHRDRALARRFAEEGRRTVRSRFDGDAHAARLVSLFTEAAA